VRDVAHGLEREPRERRRDREHALAAESVRTDPGTVELAIRGRIVVTVRKHLLVTKVGMRAI
jgi:hypothetical protein